MSAISPHFQLRFEPLADPAAVVTGPHVRFTVLTSRLLRLEHSPTDRFEDRPSQPFWFRRQPVPDFEVVRSAATIEIITAHLHLRYRVQPEGFTAESLSITLKAEGTVWRCGDDDSGNLRGTCCTLDGADGVAPLEPGLVSRSGWAVVDDSHTLVFNDEGWLAERESDGQDLYFFGYGHDYRACLRDYSALTGPTPMIPRWALGNWWSRYWAYHQDDLRGLMEDFRAHEVPLSVCIIDMDWHITVTGNTSTGWTGYTWNRALFPDPARFIAWLHGQGLKTALNLHPGEGIHPHEAQYEEMAAALGVDPASRDPLPFDIADPRFAKAYFETIHHPMEAQGVDFWWMDWQQGHSSTLPGLEPLWWLNHLHFYDLGRDGYRRPFIFSRWGGLGNHRYPIGFSGDTHISWASLAYQPYFTATAANVGYGWWSHDIGGHMSGVEDRELYTRWVQYGVFSPILRLHSTKNPFHERRPWGYDREVLHITREAMQLRHALIPYLYTMAWRNHREAIPLITPMYHTSPEREEAYVCPDQYAFGSELIAAPYVAPADPDTRLSRQVVWLPEGDWFNFFDGTTYPGDAWYALYGTLDEIPVFARAGGIVPLGPRVGWGGVENPAHLTIYVFPGADNRFELYEDDGSSTDFTQGHYALTALTQTWMGSGLAFTIEPVQGDRALLPACRTYTLVFRAVREPDRVTLTINGAAVAPEMAYDAATESLTVGGIRLAAADSLAIMLAVDSGSLLSRRDRTLETGHKLLKAFAAETPAKHAVLDRLPRMIGDGSGAVDFAPILDSWAYLKDSHLRALAEVLTGAGLTHITHTGDEILVLWNNRETQDITYQLSIREKDWPWRTRLGHGVVPRFKAIPLADLRQPRWRLKVDLCDLLSVVLQGGG